MPTDFPVSKAGGAGSIGGIGYKIGVVTDIFLRNEDIIDRAQDNDFFYDEFSSELDRYSVTNIEIVAKASDERGKKIDAYITEQNLKDQKYIGAVRYKLANQLTQDSENLPIAFPLNPNFYTLPLLNEIILIHETDNGNFYERVRGHNSPNFSTNIGLLEAANKPKDGSFMQEKGIDAFKKAEAGIPESNIKKTPNNIPKNDVGKYFKRELNYHYLRPYEGDTIIQGRHGNSIRFSGHAHPTREQVKKAYPSILIRNNENDKSKNNIKIYDYTIEDINEDGTSIHITSGEYISNFSDTLKIKKEANNVYPPKDKLKGDQIVVNTGRLILSTKANEIYIFSKMSTSFWTDDFFTIDAQNGYRAVIQDGDYYTKLAGQSRFHTIEINDTGKICLGGEPDSVSATSKVQQAVKGNALAEVLDRLVMVLMDTYQMKTPSGITDFGPVDKSELSKIQSDLKNILSNNNFLI